jgi:hypothetical protein
MGFLAALSPQLIIGLIMSAVSFFSGLFGHKPTAALPAPTPAPIASPSTATTTAASTAPAPSSTPVASASPTPTATPPANWLVYEGAGSNTSSVDCLLAQLSQAGVPATTANEQGLTSLTGIAGIVFPDGNANQILATLAPAIQQLIQTAVTQNGLNILGTGAGAQLPGLLGMLGNGTAAGATQPQQILQGGNPIVSILTSLVGGVIQEFLGITGANGSQVAVPQTDVIGRFANGLPALIQSFLGQGSASLLLPSTTGATGGMAASSCANVPQIFPVTGGNTIGTQPVANPILTLIQGLVGAVHPAAAAPAAPAA